MKQSLTKLASLSLLKMLMVVVMAMSFTGAFAQSPFTIDKFYPDQTTPPQLLQEKTTVYVYLTNTSSESLTITALDISLTQNGKVVAQSNLKLSKGVTIAAGKQGTVSLKYTDYADFFGKCSAGEVTMAVYGVTYNDASGASQHYENASSPLGSVVYKVSSNPTITSTKGFESKVLYTFYDANDVNGTFTMYFSEPVVDNGKIEVYLEYGDANATYITDVPFKLAADGKSLTVDFRNMDLSYDVVSQGHEFKDDNGNVYRPSKISLVAKNLETADGTLITSKTTAPNGSVIIVSGAQFSWNYKEEKSPTSGGGDDPNPPTPTNPLTITCNTPEGINLVVNGKNNEITTSFVGNTATVEGEVVSVRISNVEPYVITSVKVDGKEATAIEEGSLYVINVTSATQTIAITVKKQEVPKIAMAVDVEGLSNFTSLQILGADGKAIASKSNLSEGENFIEFSQDVLPLQLTGRWAEGYEIEVALNGNALKATSETATSATYSDIQAANGANLAIKLTKVVVPQVVTLTVNEAKGVSVRVEKGNAVEQVTFTGGKAEVTDPEVVKISAVDPYEITSVKVNGKAVAAASDGTYVINVTEDVKTIAIEVQEKVVPQVVTVTVNDVDGVMVVAEIGGEQEAIAFDTTGKAEVTDAKTITIENIEPYVIESVTVNGKAVAPAADGSYVIEVNEEVETIAITVKKVEVVVPQIVTVTVNDIDGVMVVAEIDGEQEAIAFDANGKAEVEDAQTITIENIEPYVIESVTVNGKAVAPAADGSYVIEVTEDVETIAITVKKVEVVVPQVVTVTVNDVDGVMVVAEIDGEQEAIAFDTTGKAEVTDAKTITIENIEPYVIESVTVNGKAVAPAADGSYVIEVTEDVENIAITVKKVVVVVPQVVTLTVNEVEGATVVATINGEQELVAFDQDGKAQVEDAQTITIENIEPYVIESVTVNGKAVAPAADGSYVIEVTEEVETIAITVKKVEVVVPQIVTVTVNDVDGVMVVADLKDGDQEAVAFDNGKAEVAEPKTFHIYNIEPYIIESVVVDGAEVKAIEEGMEYLIEVIPDMAHIAITVKKVEVVVPQTVTVTVNDVDGVMVVAEIDGEQEAIAFDTTGKVEVTDAKTITIENIEPYVIELVEVNGKAVEAAADGSYVIDVTGEVETIAITVKKEVVVPAHIVTVTVNDSKGVNVFAEDEEGKYNVPFDDNKAEVEDAQFIIINNIDPYTIESVEVNGKAIEPIEEGTSYFIEVTEEVETVAITVKEQQVVKMAMTVKVEGLDNFTTLAIMGRNGETQTLAYKKALVEGESKVEFTNLDLPLQVYGNWEDGMGYEMTLAINNEVVEPMFADSTSAQYIDLDITDGATMTITLLVPQPTQSVTLTVNEAEGVQVIADVEDDTVDVEFTEGKAEVEDAQYIRIYNQDPYIISSVKVNGKEEEAMEAGMYYFIEVTEEVKTIDITVEKQEVVDMTMTVNVEGLENFVGLFIMERQGETGNFIATNSTLEEGANTVEFTNLALPLQVYGTWADGTGYEMEVTLNGKVLEAALTGPTSAQYMDIIPTNGSVMNISLKAPVQQQIVSISVNDVDGVTVIADMEEDVEAVMFNEEGKAEVANPMFILIYNVEPYLISSVKVNGQDVEAMEEGAYYFIEVTEETKAVEITVERQQVVNMSMLVLVEGLDRFEDLVIMDQHGELGKALATKEQLSESEFTEVWFTNFDLPLQVYGTWEDGKDYKMIVKVDGVDVSAVQEGPTSALFMGIEVEQGSFLTIQLKDQTTAINLVEAEAINGKWYNLQGIEVNKANLLKGNVYINAGHKYLVK